MPTNYDAQINPLQSSVNTEQNNLDTSVSANRGSEQASASDIKAQERLMTTETALQKLKDKQLSDQWYGPKATRSADDTAPPSGGIADVLNVLMSPAQAVEATAETALGKGNVPGWGANVVDNITKGHRTFSNLLQKEGAPYGVSAPLGFALDVAFDPVNWLTAGTNAVIPRIATGLIKGAATEGVSGALEAASAGARSSLPGVMTSRLVSAVGKNTPYLANTVMGQAMGKAPQAAAEAADTFGRLVGKTSLGTNMGYINLEPGIGYGSDYRIRLGDLAQQAITSLPGGDSLWKSLNYSNQDWLRLVYIKDALQKALGTSDDVKTAANAVIAGQPLEEVTQQMAQKIGEGTPALAADKPSLISWEGNGIPSGDVDKGLSAALGTIGRSEVAGDIQQGINDAAEIAHNPSLGTSMDPTENALRLASEFKGSPVLSLDEVKKMVNSGAMGDTGIQWFDNMMNKIRLFKISVGQNSDNVIQVGQKTMDFYDKWLTLFRAAKVTGSPSSIVNAMLGNPAFFAMMGGNITDPKYWGMLKGASGYNLGTKTSSGFWQRLLAVPQIKRYIDENPTAINSGFGIPTEDRQKVMTAQQIINIARDFGTLPEGTTLQTPGVMKQLNEIIDSMKQTVAEGMATGAGHESRSMLEQKLNLNPRGGLQAARKAFAETGDKTSRIDLPTGMMSQEYFESSASRRMLNMVHQRSLTGNWMWKAADTWLNRAPSFYEGIDQTYKLGTFSHLTLNGVTERELNIMRRTVPMTPEDIMDRWNDNGMWRYRLAPDKAMQVVTESYLNYAAMPGFVRMMRNFPLLGAPFASFAYGASIKTASSMVYNPAFFNKMSFTTKDFGGRQSPLEKEAVMGKGSFYNYFNQPTMFRLPFFKENPLYMNLAYALPYYSLNAFTPSQRSYQDFLPNALVQTIDKAQLMQNPVGQVLFNYVILPSIISQASPQGSFGEPLYPIGATGGQKAFYAGRSLAESVVPGFASIPGGLAQGAAAPGLTEDIPSYRWRQIAYGLQGKNVHGIQGGKNGESAPSRTLRGVAAALGVPIQAPIDLSTVTSQNAKVGK